MEPLELTWLTSPGSRFDGTAMEITTISSPRSFVATGVDAVDVNIEQSREVVIGRAELKCGSDVIVKFCNAHDGL